MRSQLLIPSQLDSKFRFKIANSQNELTEAYKILYQSYVDLGYSKEISSQMRIVKYFALPTTTTLIALYENRVVGTISIVRRSVFGVPMESEFDLTELVEKNEVFAEISSLAIDSEFRQNRGALFLPLLKFFWEYVENYMNLDSIVITVNPSMTDFYEAFLSFSRLKKATISNYSFANGNPGVGLYLNVRDARKLFMALYDHKPPEKNLFRYFIDLKLKHFELPIRNFYKSCDPVMTPQMLDYFFVKKSNVFSELNKIEVLGLNSAYPAEHYRHVLPTSDLNMQRAKVRYLVNMKATSFGREIKNVTILSVAENGLCVVSKERLLGIVTFQIEVAAGRSSAVQGVVRWENEPRNIYGIELLKSDGHWKEFLDFLKLDFDSLNTQHDSQ